MPVVRHFNNNVVLVQTPGGRQDSQRLRVYTSEASSLEDFQQRSKKGNITPGLLAIAAFGALHCACTQPAHAWGQTWRPRRHHRRMDQKEREPNLGKYTKAAIEARRLNRALEEQQEESLDEESETVLQQIGNLASNVKSKLLQQDQVVREAGSNRQGRSFSPLVAASLILLALLLGRWLWGLLKAVNWSGSGRKRGRYVRDRGLGGKEVFIEEDAVVPRLVGEIASPNPGAAPVSGQTGPPDPWLAYEAKAEEVWSSPAWWAPPHTIYIEPIYKKEAKEEAQAVVNRMTNAKVAGQDYSLGSLVSIRQLCGETGVTVEAKTQRDPIFRAAADMAAACAEDGLNKLGGQSPGRFLSGLAQDLGIPEKEAVNMVNAVVAKRCRQSLITACACYRENENDDIMFQLLKLSGLMTALPLPAGSAQADMVATGLQQRATLPERQAIFLTYGCMDQASAALIAELMGFQPTLVMPQLHKHILQGRRGYPSAA